MSTLASEALEAVRFARWIEHDEVQRLKDQRAQLVDVLDEDAFKKAHISGSINIPLKQIEDDVARLDATARSSCIVTTTCET